MASTPIFSSDLGCAPLLSLDQVSYRAAGRTIVERVDLTIGPGEIVSLIGPNGSGKTTLVKIAVGLLPPSIGHVGHAPGLTVGYMPQRLHIDLALPLTVRRFVGLTPGGAPTSVAAALDELGIASLANRSIHDISGGELQRALLARAILRRPHILVLDEPAQGVDIAGQAELYRLIASFRQRYGTAVLLVSHDLHLVMSATDRVVCINRHICCSGHPDSVSRDPAFQALFGPEHAAAFALYAHDHDHAHDLRGTVVGKPEDHRR